MQRLGITSVLLVILAGCGGDLGTERAALGGVSGASEALLSGAPDPVVAWNVTASQMIVGPGGAARVPVIGLVEAAMVHTAIYDAVNAIAGDPYRNYGNHPTVARPASGYAATAAAAHDVLLALYPANASELDAAYATSLSYVPD